MILPVIQKPLYRTPCNRCGQCCLHGPCELAVDFLDALFGEPCRALEIEEDGRTSCGLAKRPLYYINPQLAGEAEQINGWTNFPSIIALYLGFGQGCGMEDA